MKILLISGPPRSGKDTVAFELLQIFEEIGGVRGYITPIALALKEAAHGLYAALNGEPVPHHRHFEACKDLPSTFFMGETPRKAYIRLHEDYLKQVHGQTVLSDLCAERISRLPDGVAIITDLGNDAQANSFRRLGDVVLLRLSRPDVEWTDNRRPISRGVYANELEFNNNGTLADMRLWIRKHLLSVLLG